MAIYGLNSATKTKLKEVYGNKGGTKTALKEIYGSNGGVKDLIFSAKNTIDLSNIDAVMVTTSGMSVRKIGSSSWTVLPTDIISCYTDSTYRLLSFVPGYISFGNNYSYNYTNYTITNSSITGEVEINQSYEGGYRYYSNYLLCNNKIYRAEIANTNNDGYGTGTGTIYCVTDKINYYTQFNPFFNYSFFRGLSISNAYVIANNIIADQYRIPMQFNIQEIYNDEDDEYCTGISINSLFDNIINSYAYYKYLDSYRNGAERWYLGECDYTIYAGNLYFAIVFCNYENTSYEDISEYTESGFCINLYNYNFSSKTCKFMGYTNVDLTNESYYSYTDGNGNSTCHNVSIDFEVSVNGSYVYIKSVATEYNDSYDAETGNSDTDDNTTKTLYFRTSTSSSNTVLSTYSSFPTNLGGDIITSRGEYVKYSTSKPLYRYLPKQNYTG